MSWTVACYLPVSCLQDQVADNVLSKFLACILLSDDPCTSWIHFQLKLADMSECVHSVTWELFWWHKLIYCCIVFPYSHTHVQLYHWQKSSTFTSFTSRCEWFSHLQDNAYEWHPWKWWVSLTTLVLPLGLSSSHCQVHCRIWSCPRASADCNCNTGCLTVCLMLAAWWWWPLCSTPCMVAGY